MRLIVAMRRVGRWFGRQGVGREGDGREGTGGRGRDKRRSITSQAVVREGVTVQGQVRPNRASSINDERDAAQRGTEAQYAEVTYFKC